MKYKVGDRVRIVSEAPERYPYGGDGYGLVRARIMSECPLEWFSYDGPKAGWLGKAMTIRVADDCCRVYMMEETKSQKFCFFEQEIAGYAACGGELQCGGDGNGEVSDD